MDVQTEQRNPESEAVVAVCGNEARVYGPGTHDKRGYLRRPLWGVFTYSNHGQALQHYHALKERR